MPNVLVAGYMSASCVGLDALAKRLEKLEVPVRSFLLENGREEVPSKEELREAAEWADVTVIGRSGEQDAWVELTAARLAMERGKPFGIYCDIFEGWKNPWLKSYAERAAFMFVCGETDAVEARKTFPECNVVVAGDVRWEKYFLPADRSAVRKRIGANENDVVILAAASESTFEISGLWQECIEVAYDYLSEARFSLTIRVLCTYHPVAKLNVREVHARLLELGNGIHPGLEVALFEGRGITDDLVPGADVVISYLSASATTHAACRRIPAIEYAPLLAELQLEQTIGVRRSYAAEHGAIAQATSLDGLISRGLLDGQTAKQEQLFPHRAPGQTVQIMANAVLRAVEKK